MENGQKTRKCSKYHSRSSESAVRTGAGDVGDISFAHFGPLNLN